MLDLVCRRAGLKDGMKVLDLGCGWGSLSLWIAEHYPKCQITAVSNSRDQIQFIQEQALKKGYANIEARVIDVNQLEESLEGSFERVFSIEMFEHMKNYRRLMKVISNLLSTEGKLFVHHFSHRIFCYEFDSDGKGSWMSQTFFSEAPCPRMICSYTFRMTWRYRTTGAWVETTTSVHCELGWRKWIPGKKKSNKCWLIHMVRIKPKSGG